jgi:hypothetical protein
MKNHVIKPKIRIYCNGEIAEPVYFQDFKDYLKSRAIIICSKRFKGLSPWELIKKVVAEKENLQNGGKFYDEDGDKCWCVFDVDEFWNQNPQKFTTAVKLARTKNIHLAWSNECFELWYLLHFQVLQTDISRRDYDRKLKKYFRKLDGKNYSKNSSAFGRLAGKQLFAIKNAKQIFRANKVEKNPSTAVFQLVEVLNSYFG